METEDFQDPVGQKLSLAGREEDPKVKLEALNFVIDHLVADKDAILDNYQDELCRFSTDDSPDVRVEVLRFIYHSVQTDVDSLPSLSPTISQLMNDSSTAVVCRTLGKLCHILRVYRTRPSVTMAVKEILVDIYSSVIRLLDDEHDSIRTQAVRTMEEFITFENEDISVVFSNAIVTLTDFLKKATVSNGNLVAGLTALSRITKNDTALISTVISEYECLNASLPPTLSVTQVKNVRKLMKIQLIDIIKTTPQAQNHLAAISVLLFDLGLSKNDLEKVLKQLGGGKKGEKRKGQPDVTSKRDKDERPAKRNRADDELNQLNQLSESILIRLTPENVIALVIDSMSMVPDTMPASFSASYTPINSAGSDTQKKSLARLLANQITQAGLARRSESAPQSTKSSTRRNRTTSNNERSSKQPTTRTTVINPDIKGEVVSSSTGSRFVARQEFNLDGVTNELTREAKFEMVKMAVDDMLQGLRTPNHNPTIHAMMTKIVAHFSGTLPMTIADLIEKSTNPKNRLNLALSWLYAEYVEYLDIRESPEDLTALGNYNVCITILLTLLKEKNADTLFTHLLFQAPILTEETFGLLAQFCIDGDDQSSESLVSNIGKLAIQRPTNRTRLLELLLQLATHYVRHIRVRALDQIVTMYEKFSSSKAITSKVSQHINKALEHLTFEHPPESLSELTKSWTDDLIERCLDLALAILPYNASVLTELANIFRRTQSPTVKMMVTRAIDAPVRRLSQTNPDLLNLVKNCPVDCAALVTRLLHIITERRAIEQELIDAVRFLMTTDQKDVRFLIPILGVLSKDEVIESLPELITLHKKVVKDVFYRLLGVQRGAISEGEQKVAPLKATELLVELHKMEGGSVKPAIEAIALCLAEKQVFTLEVFASAISHMLKMPKLPTLFMRTVLQALITHPRITSQIISTLSQLIAREVWENPKLWDGFVMCCQKLKTRCVSVLLQLPEEPLNQLMTTAPELRSYLAAHIESIEPSKRSKIGEYFQKIAMLPSL